MSQSGSEKSEFRLKQGRKIRDLGLKQGQGLSASVATPYPSICWIPTHPSGVPFNWPIKSKNYERSRDSAHEIQLWCSHSFILISQLTQTPGGSWQKDVETLTTTNQKLWSNIYQQYQQIWKCQGQAVSITELRSYRSWYLTDRLTVKRLLWQQPLGSWQKDVKKLTIKNFAQVALVRSTASSRSKNA